MTFSPKTIGIIGGGQLSRMSALAAARLGVRVCILSPEEDSPAAQVVPFTFVGDHANHALLKEFASCVDVITYEHGNISPDSIRYLQKFKPVYPDDRVLEITRNRIREKQFLNEIGVETPHWAAINRAQDIQRAMEDMELTQAILKIAQPPGETAKQIEITPEHRAKTLWRDMDSEQLILEEKIDFACEISMIVARDLLGQTAIYDPILNERQNNTLSKSTIPARIPEPLVKKANTLTQFLAEALDMVGVLCVEYFVTSDGRLLVNTISPYPHNSGHVTMDAGLCSQFEQQIRTVCGMQVGAPNRHTDAVMHNLIGDDVQKLNRYLEMPNASVHLYGKSDPKDGRKMGHITIIGPVELDLVTTPPNILSDLSE